MPEDSFLQQFHNLAAADEEVRLKAAVAVRQALTADGDSEKDNLQYSIKRLVRGVQSSRQCARQGFSLALAELLAAHPAEIAQVTPLISQVTQLQSGLKASEQKERLMGRLFAYVAVCQSGCFSRLGKDPLFEGKLTKQAKAKLVAELGTGLHEIYAARPFLRTPAAQLLAALCRELCAAGLTAEVPSLLAPWGLDEALRTADDDGRAFTAGLVWCLRALHQDLTSGGKAAAALESWPLCIRQDPFTKPPLLDKCVQSLAADIHASAFSDALPFPVEAFCEWWLRAAAPKQGGQLWAVFDQVLFPEKAANSALAQGMRTTADLLHRLCTSAVVPGNDKRVEELVVAFFQHMQRGLGLLFKTLRWPRAPTHSSAVFAHDRIVQALGIPDARGARGGAKSDPPPSAPARRLELSDKARLSILASMQQHVAFGSLPNVWQRKWHQVLLAPLSRPGVASRYITLMDELRTSRAAAKQQDVENPSEAAERAVAAIRPLATQIEQMCLHPRASDDVVLAGLFLLFGMAFCGPSGDDAHACSISLRDFCAATGLVFGGEADLVIPLQSVVKADADAAEERSMWRARFWAAVSNLVRRPLPDMSEKLLQSGAAYSADEDEGAAAPTAVRTHAYHGCLSDGSLLVMRLHDWWDHLASSVGAATASGGKKKQKRSGPVPLLLSKEMSEADLALRRRCVDHCKALLATTEEQTGMTTRQRNALCNVPLCIALGMAGIEDEEGKAALREHLEEFEGGLSKLVAATSKSKGKVSKALTGALEVVPRIAAELFVGSTGLVKEAARTAWRELGGSISAETLSSLCASVRDEEEDEDSDESGEDDEDEDGEGPPSEAAIAKTNAFEIAKERLKAEREAAAAAGGSKAKDQAEAGSDDEADLVIMDADTMLDELLGEEDGSDNKNVLDSFAASGLEGDPAQAQKVSKRQKRLRARQEDIERKFRELELLEIFLTRFGDKAKVSAELLQDLHKTLAAACRNAAKSGAKAQTQDEEGDKGKSKAKKGGTRVDSASRQLEAALAARVAKLLQKALKHMCGPSAVIKIAKWHEADEWAKLAEASFAAGVGAKAANAGQRSLDVGALLLYFFCSAHHTCSGKWEVAEKVARNAVQDWSSKKDCEKWCEAVLNVFACRAPHVLLELPWLDSIRDASRTPFVQRAQVTFLAGRLHQLAPNAASGPAGGGAAGPATVRLAGGFAGLCAELLERTLDEEAGMSGVHRHKLRREVLRGLKAAMKTRRRHGQTALPEDSAKRIVAAAAKVRDALPGRHGEVYQLCLHVLRSSAGAAAGGEKRAAKAAARAASSASSDGEGRAAAKRKRDQSAPRDAAAAGEKKKKARHGGPQVSKDNKHAFKDM